jgi:hypothetical protein
MLPVLGRHINYCKPREPKENAEIPRTTDMWGPTKLLC